MLDARKNILSLGEFPQETPAFLRGESDFVSRRDFFKKITALTQVFRSREEKTFLLFSEDTIFFAEHFLAILSAGKNVALPPTNAPAFIENLKKTLNAPLISDAHENEEKLNVPAEKISDDAPSSFPPNFDEVANCEVILFSSGSTATPKQIRKKFSNFADETVLHAEIFSKIFSQKNATGTPLPLFVGCVHCHHTYGLLHRLLLPLALGACIDAELILSPEKLIARQRAFPQICLVATPSFLGKIARYREQYSFPQNCFRISSSGSALDEKTAVATQEIFGTPPLEIYGSTETGGIATRYQTNGQIWNVLPSVEISTTHDGNTLVRSPFCIPPKTEISDSIKILSPREFLLFGRTDRLVKIAEKRVSLPEMEAIFNRCEIVRATHLLELEKSRLGAVIEPSQRGVEILKKSGKREFVSTLKTSLAGALEAGVFPKKIRIVNEIPTNAQGKILREKTLALFTQNVAEPILENISFGENFVSADATFLPDAIYFRGHFPSFQLLPGVAQLYFAHFFAQKFFGKNFNPTHILKLKFSAMIFPRETVRMELRDMGAQISFSFKKGETLCSSGLFCEREPDPTKNV